MLVKVQLPRITPSSAAVATLEGGLLYSRITRADRVQELTRGAEYSRAVREWIPRRSNPDWKTPRAQRISYPAGRTVCLHRPPTQGNPAGLVPARAYPEGWGLPFDGLETSAYWEKRFHRVNPPGGPAGTPYLEVSHRGGLNFKSWVTHRARFTGGVWGHRPRKEQDPLRGVYDYLHRGGSSPLGGLRGGSSRADYLSTRLSRLYRRGRQHQLLDHSLETLQLYRRASRRKKKSPPEARLLLFRRRRLRNYLTGVVSHRNYVNRLTRRGFYRWHPNRWSRLERASLLGGSYVEPRTLWGNHLLGSRVGTPLEYNLYSPFTGFGRLLKRRREGARRWKLAQHATWGPPHLQARQARWSWFRETPLGALLGATPPTPPEVPTTAGEGVSLVGSLYWSLRTWGRSRWERPTGRRATGFIWALKGGTTVEPDSQTWGRAGTSGVGVFLSFVGELELRSRWFFSSFPGRGVNSPPGTPQRGLVGVRRRVTHWARWLAWGATAGVWFFFTPIWWVYAGIAQGLCYTAWWIRRGWWWGYSFCSAGSELISQLGNRLVWDPLGQYLVHWVKDTPFFKTMAWVWVSWSLVYSSDEEQRKLDLTPVEPTEDQSQEYFLDEVEPTGENLPGDDDDDDELHEGMPRVAYRTSWIHPLDFAWEEGLDELEYLFWEEIPYRVGFFFQPLLDLALRLPLWGFLEGFSLLTLGVKLEYQRGWTKLLSAGGGPHRGRWWKIPLVVGKTLLTGGVWLTLIWLVGSTLSYSTLRLEVVYWGIPWREEYYLFWWCTVGALVTKLVGPAGVKNFLFSEVGWANLGGLFWGATEVAQPESYQPPRPNSPFVSAARTFGGMNMRRHKSYDDILYHVRETDLYVGGGVNAGFDEALLVLAHRYEHGDSLNWDEPDEANYFNVPLHLVHSLEEETNSPYSVYGPPKESNEFRTRGFREPHFVRTNYYELTYDSMLGRFPPPVYFEANLKNGFPLQGHHISPATEFQHFTRDETQFQNPSDSSNEFNS